MNIVSSLTISFTALAMSVGTGYLVLRGVLNLLQAAVNGSAQIALEPVAVGSAPLSNVVEMHPKARIAVNEVEAERRAA